MSDLSRGLLGLLVTLFAAGNVSALTIEAPRAMHEGTAAKVWLKGERASDHKWEVIFLWRVYKFFIEGNDAVAIIAVPLDEPAGSRTIVFENDSRELRRWIEIKKKSFPVSVVTFPPLSREELGRNNKEKAEILKITGIYSDGHWPRQFYWPLEQGGCDVVSAFGKKRLNSKKKLIGRHWGVDCRAREGDLVHSASGGIVQFARETLLGGKTVIIDHGFGVFSIYMHLLGTFVAAGEEVGGWNVIGTAGATGRASGPHLHIAVKVNSIDVDPIEFLKMGGAK